MARGLLPFDKRYLGGAGALVGIDEAGRGCLAGPVVAAAVRCSRAFYASSWGRSGSRGVNDSKILDGPRRAAVVRRYRRACEEGLLCIGIGLADTGEIQRLNIYHATTLAMRRALEQTGMTPADESLWKPGRSDADCVLLIDGRPIRDFPYPHDGITGGDRRSLAIALAGIHAKEWRDAHMRELDARYPGYGFARHKGYGTAHHLEAIRKLGPAPVHRMGFLKKVCGGREAVFAYSQDSLFPPGSR